MKKQTKKGFTCGAFDLVHAGHVMMFKEAKDHCDHLTVFLQTDPSIDRPGKNKPVMSLEERKTILEGIRYVDDIVIYETEAELYELMSRLPAGTIRIIGSDWKGKKFTGWDLPIEIVYNSRNHSLSTSELRARIHEAEERKRAWELEAKGA